MRSKIVFLLIGWSVSIFAQAEDEIQSSFSDTVVTLQDVEITNSFTSPFRWQAPVSIGLVSGKEIHLQSVSSLVPAMNSIPGVRMEERSPGSYRLSIRGSLVRSPYGVRNVKIYYNGFSLTDAGGNTYLNAINSNDLSAVEVIKGPDGSLYGANSGGVVFLKSYEKTETNRAEAYGGHWGLAGNVFHLGKGIGKHSLSLKQSYQRSDGYRQNSANHRFFVQLSDKWDYMENYRFEAYLFYSDLFYRTPGGLTKEQYEDHPTSARLPTATIPGSVEQKTAISQKMYFGGIHHYAHFSPRISHAFSMWVHHVDFVYPFITNYEIRKEDNVGVRTSLSYQTGERPFYPLLEGGFEGQRLVTDAYNYDNHTGEKGHIQAYNDIVNTQSFVFLRGKINQHRRLFAEASVSVNFNSYHFRDTTQLKRNFKPVWMPHLGINYFFHENAGIRFTLSRGYSTPTTAELRPSDNKIYTGLQAEKGWNYEVGFRLKLLRGCFTGDVSYFHYMLKDGIISQTDSTGNTYFVNSGRIKQNGIEYNSSFLLFSLLAANNFLKEIRWNSSYTYSFFLYDKYLNEEANYSGNRVAGVPRHVIVNSLSFRLPLNIGFFIQHNFTSRIPLNDANNEYASSYHLVAASLDIPFFVSSNPLHFYIKGDNLLNQKYSLGNDINAVGGRYYNAAPTINFQVGMSYRF